jgi:hypothetical protein
MGYGFRARPEFCISWVSVNHFTIGYRGCLHWVHAVIWCFAIYKGVCIIDLLSLINLLSLLRQAYIRQGHIALLRSERQARCR